MRAGRAILGAVLAAGLAGCGGGLPRLGGGGGGAGPELTLLPGGVGIACDANRRDLGREVARFPAEGRAAWAIHDTAPDSTAPRLQYITGFSDGCPRAVEAALVVFGAPRVYEALRYDPGTAQPETSVDTAYEAIKRRVCGVAARAFCPPDRIDRLEARTAFVTVYPTFGGGPGATLLLDSGDLVSVAAP